MKLSFALFALVGSLANTMAEDVSISVDCQGIDYDADLEPEVAGYLQTVAWEIVGFYRGRDDQAASRAREPAR